MKRTKLIIVSFAVFATAVIIAAISISINATALSSSVKLQQYTNETYILENPQNPDETFVINEGKVDTINMLNLSNTYRAIEDDSKSTEAVAYVNGKVIIKEDLDKQKASIAANSNMKTKTDREIIDELIDKEVLWQYAEANNLVVSIDAARKYSLDIVEQMNDSIANGSDEEKENAQYVLDSLTAFAEGYGLTYAEYTEQVVIPGEQIELSCEAAKEKYLNSRSAEEVKTNDARKAAVAEWILELRAQAEIEYTNENMDGDIRS